MKRLAFVVMFALTFVFGGTAAFAGDQAAISDGGGTSPAPQTTTTAPQSALVSVAIQNMAYSPANITVPAGTTVTWINRDTVPHTVTRDGVEGPLSGTLQPGQTFSFTYNRAGTFTYHCLIHPNMQGTVTVTTSSAVTTPVPSNVPATSTPAPTAPTAPTTPSTSATSTATSSATSTTSTANANASAQATAAQAEPPRAVMPSTKAAQPAVLPNTGTTGLVIVTASAAAIGTGLYWVRFFRKRL